MVRYVRVTYVRHATCSNDNDVVGRVTTSPSTGFSYNYIIIIIIIIIIIWDRFLPLSSRHLVSSFFIVIVVISYCDWIQLQDVRAGAGNCRHV